MSQVERAIIMAAGKGTRMKPITNKVPKPLVKVNGKAMIEGVIEKLHEQGIQEIYVVVGYLKGIKLLITVKFLKRILTFLDITVSTKKKSIMNGC